MIAIVGSGTMGKEIALEIAYRGSDVLLVSAERRLPPAKQKEEIDKFVAKFYQADNHDFVSRITLSNDFEMIRECSVIIEAVYENLEKKRELLREIRPYICDTTVVFSNTSSLSIRNIFEGIIPLERVSGMHFFNPVHIMKLVEVATLEETANTTTDLIVLTTSMLEKEVVYVKDSPGFIVNRILIPMINEAAKVYDEGVASAEDIDRAMRLGANHPIGPLKLSDLIGNDIVLEILLTMKKRGSTIHIAKSLENLVIQGRLGRKTKSGYFEYK